RPHLVRDADRTRDCAKPFAVAALAHRQPVLAFHDGALVRVEQRECEPLCLRALLARLAVEVCGDTFCQALPGLDRSHTNAVGATILENSGSDNELRAAVAGRRSGAPDAGRYEYGGRRRSPVLPCKSATVKHLLVWRRSPNGRLLVTVWPRYGSAL